ncbi:MAG: lactate utilization protein [bacterium]|nr:lactate utilization protein [bacterium]MDO5462575.1 lactate utilization protein [bacterium]
MEQSKVNEMLAWASQKKLDAVGKKLEARGFKVIACADRTAARSALMKLLAAPEHQTIGFGGSMSVGVLEVEPELAAAGKTLLNHGNPSLSFEEKMAVMRAQLTCDVFVASTNALTEDGILVNIDGNGNRVAAMIFGPKQVVLVVGRNKLVPDVHAGLERIAQLAGPVNAYRLNRKTPCATTGSCGHCSGACPESICRMTTIVKQPSANTPTTILLVNDDLGL